MVDFHLLGNSFESHDAEWAEHNPADFRYGHGGKHMRTDSSSSQLVTILWVRTSAPRPPMPMPVPAHHAHITSHQPRTHAARAPRHSREWPLGVLGADLSHSVSARAWDVGVRACATQASAPHEGFLNRYSTSSIAEDKAEIWAALMCYQQVLKSPSLLAKAGLLKKRARGICDEMNDKWCVPRTLRTRMHAMRMRVMVAHAQAHTHIGMCVL